MKEKYYISGKITGENYFTCYKKFLNAIYWFPPTATVYNPMSLCNQNWSWIRCMLKCFFYLIFKANTIVILPDFKESKGALIELAIAILLKKKIIWK